MKRFFLTLALAGWSLVGQGAPAVLDQQNVAPLDSYLNGGHDIYVWQQGVTAGLSGQLAQIDLFVGDPGETRVSINAGAPWQIDAPDWEAVVMLQRGWNAIDVASANVMLTTGNQFAIGVHGQSPISFPPAIAFSYGEAYTGGSLYLNGSSSQSVGHDMLFRTYVLSVPEPGTLALLGLGLAGLAATRRRKH